VVGVGQAVPDRYTGVARQQLGGVLAEAAVFDPVVVAPQHPGGILEGLLLAHLAVGEKGDMPAFVVDRNLKGTPRSGGCFVEYQDDALAVEKLRPYPGTLLLLEVQREVQQVLDLLGAQILQGQKMSSSQINRHAYLQIRACMLVP